MAVIEGQLRALIPSQVEAQLPAPPALEETEGRQIEVKTAEPEVKDPQSRELLEAA